MAWSYEDARRFLDGLVNHERLVSGRPGDPSAPPTLDRMRELCGILGDPQDAQPAIHITGTNGKGSTTRMVSALLAAHNLTAGAYTSPDLGRPNERITRNNEPLDDDAFAEVAEAVAALLPLVSEPPTYFEVMEAMAFRWFADAAVDVAVVEVGMGGRLDGTNVVNGAVAVVTNVALDHVEIIGPTRADIAREKAGIVKRGATLVLGELDPVLLPIFEGEQPEALWLRDRDFGVERNDVAVGGRLLDIVTPYARYDEVFLSMHGEHQGDNAAVAVAAVEAFFGRAIGEDVVREALGTVTNPGRFEVVRRSPLVVLDGAHNAHGAVALARTLDDFAVTGERILVVGTLRPHDPVELLGALDATKARVVVATQPEWPRRVPAGDVAAAAAALGVDVEVVADVAGAVRRAIALAADEDLVVVTGSLYTVGEARQALVRA